MKRLRKLSLNFTKDNSTSINSCSTLNPENKLCTKSFFKNKFDIQKLSKQKASELYQTLLDLDYMPYEYLDDGLSKQIT